MKTIVIFGIVVSVSFVAGGFVGANLYRKFIIRRLIKISPTFVNVISDLVRRFAAGELSDEEMRRTVQEDVSFLKIVLED